MPDLATLELKLRDTRQEIRNLQVMQMRPGLSEEKRKFLHDLERSARAEVKLRLKAIDHHKSQPTSRYLMTPEQHRQAAQALRQHNPNSRAAQLHEAAAKMRESKRK
jgi:hypothetical protein